jgi:hypothetical protein
VRRANPPFVSFYSRPCHMLTNFEGGQSLIASWQHLLRIIALLLAASGCGTTHAILNFTAPPTATAGTPFTVTVTVLYQGKPDTVINSRIHFASSDPAAALPPDYYFTPADAGSHTWMNGFTLATPGSQTVSATIADASGINGSANIVVNR